MLWHAAAQRRGSAQAESTLAVHLIWHGAARRRGSAQAESCVAVRLLWHAAAQRRGSAQAESTLAVRLLWHAAAQRRGSAPLPRFRQRLPLCLARRSEGTPSPPNLLCGLRPPSTFARHIDFRLCVAY